MDTTVKDTPTCCGVLRKPGDSQLQKGVCGDHLWADDRFAIRCKSRLNPLQSQAGGESGPGYRLGRPRQARDCQKVYPAQG